MAESALGLDMYGVNDGARTRDNWNHNPGQKNKKSIKINDLRCFESLTLCRNILCFMIDCQLNGGEMAD